MCSSVKQFKVLRNVSLRYYYSITENKLLTTTHKFSILNLGTDWK